MSTRIESSSSSANQKPKDPHHKTQGPSSLSKLRQIISSHFHKKYHLNELLYGSCVINDIIYNEKTHIVATFKDYLILDDVSEFLKRYYTKSESDNRLPKYYEYYETYSRIYPNYTALPESKYIYKNIHKKQKMIDLQQNLEMSMERKKKEKINNNLVEKDDKVFSTDDYNSIANDSSCMSFLFGVTKKYTNEKNADEDKEREEKSIVEISKLIETIGICGKYAQNVNGLKGKDRRALNSKDIFAKKISNYKNIKNLKSNKGNGLKIMSQFFNSNNETNFLNGNNKFSNNSNSNTKNNLGSNGVSKNISSAMKGEKKHIYSVSNNISNMNYNYNYNNSNNNTMLKNMYNTNINKTSINKSQKKIMNSRDSSKNKVREYLFPISKNSNSNTNTNTNTNSNVITNYSHLFSGSKTDRSHYKGSGTSKALNNNSKTKNILTNGNNVRNINKKNLVIQTNGNSNSINKNNTRIGMHISTNSKLIGTKNKYNTSNTSANKAIKNSGIKSNISKNVIKTDSNSNNIMSKNKIKYHHENTISNSTLPNNSNTNTSKILKKYKTNANLNTGVEIKSQSIVINNCSINNNQAIKNRHTKYNSNIPPLNCNNEYKTERLITDRQKSTNDLDNFKHLLIKSRSKKKEDIKMLKSKNVTNTNSTNDLNGANNKILSSKINNNININNKVKGLVKKNSDNKTIIKGIKINHFKKALDECSKSNCNSNNNSKGINNLLQHRKNKKSINNCNQPNTLRESHKSKI